MSDITDRLFELNLSRMSDDRRELLGRVAGRNPTKSDNKMLTKFIKALKDTVVSRDRTEIRGLGVFFWKPFKTHLPDGRKVVTKRLWFKSAVIRRARRGVS